VKRKEDRLYTYEGKDITVSFSLLRCTHVGECLRGDPKVFVQLRRPWVKPDLSSADKIAEVILKCPTGSLHFKRKDGGWEETVPDVNTITIQRNGPLYILGDAEVLDPDGNRILKDTRMALCRCGESRNFPFCDNQHMRVPFMDSGLAKSKGSLRNQYQPKKEALKITVDPKGPYRLSGSFTIKDNQDETVLQGTRVLLCGCGISRNKPFCDGSHTQKRFPYSLKLKLKRIKSALSQMT
jgi:CDGSH-type Zn-finger protein/uncharacterized Fe-S cluster protein YjdI